MSPKTGPARANNTPPGHDNSWPAPADCHNPLDSYRLKAAGLNKFLAANVGGGGAASGPAPNPVSRGLLCRFVVCFFF